APTEEHTGAREREREHVTVRLGRPGGKRAGGQVERSRVVARRAGDRIEFAADVEPTVRDEQGVDGPGRIRPPARVERAARCVDSDEVVASSSGDDAELPA